MEKLDRHTIEFLQYLQHSIAKMIRFKDLDVKRVRYICGVDISYIKSGAVCTAALWDHRVKEIIELSYVEDTPSFPYISGLLFMREAPLMVSACRALKKNPDLILVDGHGIAHPRRAGLAVFVGLVLNKPTLGIAKSLLVGELEESVEMLIPIRLERKIVGFVLHIPRTRRLYISPGYKVRVSNIRQILDHIGCDELIQVTRLADRYSRRLAELRRASMKKHIQISYK